MASRDDSTNSAKTGPDTAGQLSGAIQGSPGFSSLKAMWEKTSSTGEPVKEKTILTRAVVKARPLPTPPVAKKTDVEPTKPKVPDVEPKLNFRQREEAERAKEEVARRAERARLGDELTEELATLNPFNGRSCKLFRADGRSPWQMIEKFEGSFTPQPGAMSLAAFFREVFQDSKSPEDWFDNWISGHPKGKPCVSTGPTYDDNQGASNAGWYYGFSMPGGLERVGPGADVLSRELGFTSHACAATGVFLLTNNGHIDGATTVVMRYGPLGEVIWLTPIPEAHVLGYARTTGPAWLRAWRPFTRADINAYRAILSKDKYADLVLWKQLYEASK